MEFTFADFTTNFWKTRDHIQAMLESIREYAAISVITQAVAPVLQDFKSLRLGRLCNDYGFFLSQSDTCSAAFSRLSTLPAAKSASDFSSAIL